MENNQHHPRIQLIHGPNLNLLGKRETEVYGLKTLDEINTELTQLGQDLHLSVDAFQSNHEGAIVDQIQEIQNTHQGLIINPAALTHTSIAIRDAVLLLEFPVIEIHLSNIYKREPFRHKSMLADVVQGQITGLGDQGYSFALMTMAEMLIPAG
jgi:3-dehydroquinate dehydratase-2